MLLFAFALIAAPPVQTGDIVLHTSHTKQAIAVAWATKSIYTHTGVVVVENGKPYVYEAVSTVKKTPLEKWIARGDALAIKRYPNLDDKQRAKIASAAKKHLGKRYDLSFAPGEDKLYCSEYVRAVFKGAGLDVGAVEQVRNLDVDNPIVKQLVQTRWKKHPVCRGQKSMEDCWPRLLSMDIVTPASLARDDRLIS